MPFFIGVGTLCPGRQPMSSRISQEISFKMGLKMGVVKIVIVTS
jgi:hypothetical protein